MQVRFLILLGWLADTGAEQHSAAEGLQEQQWRATSAYAITIGVAPVKTQQQLGLQILQSANPHKFHPLLESPIKTIIWSIKARRCLRRGSRQRDPRVFVVVVVVVC